MQGSVQIRAVLHAVGKNFALEQGYVRSYIIIEFYDFDFQTLLFSQFFDVVHDFGMGAGSNGDLDRCVGCRSFSSFFFIAAAAEGGDWQLQHKAAAVKILANFS